MYRAAAPMTTIPTSRLVVSDRVACLIDDVAVINPCVEITSLGNGMWRRPRILLMMFLMSGFYSSDCHARGHFLASGINSSIRQRRSFHPPGFHLNSMFIYPRPAMAVSSTMHSRMFRPRQIFANLEIHES